MKIKQIRMPTGQIARAVLRASSNHFLRLPYQKFFSEDPISTLKGSTTSQANRTQSSRLMFTALIDFPGQPWIEVGHLLHQFPMPGLYLCKRDFGFCSALRMVLVELVAKL